MRSIFKLLAVPVVGALTLISAFCSFVLAMSGAVFGIISSAMFVLALVMLFTVTVPGGAAWLAAAFLISPYGLPRIAECLVGKLDGINGMLKDFILG